MLWGRWKTGIAEDVIGARNLGVACGLWVPRRTPANHTQKGPDMGWEFMWKR